MQLNTINKSNTMQVFSSNPLFKTQLLCFIGLNFLLIGSGLFERLPVNEGLGWDGTIYAKIIKYFRLCLTASILDAYYVQRIFPCGAVYIIMKVFGLAFTNENIVLVFGLYNLLLLNIVLYFWFKVLRIFFISSTIMLAGTLFLFFNFCILKFAMYYPVLTDVTALMLGMLLLYAYLNNQSIAILLIGFVSAFSHPILQYFSILLFLFPWTPETKEVRRIPLVNYLPYALCLGFTAVVLLFYFTGPDLIDGYVMNGAAPLNRKLIFISLFCVLLYLFRIGRSINTNKVPERIINSLRIHRFGVVVVVLAITFLVRKIVSAPGTTLGVNDFVLNLVLQSITNPFQFIVSHITFLGVGVLLMITYFKSYEANASRLGIGYLLFLYCTLLLAIGSETRQFIFSLPFLFLPINFIFSKISMKKVMPFILITSLILSKIWLPLNTKELTGKPLLFPDQYYFMNIGPWMIGWTYFIQLSVIVLLLGIYMILFYNKKYTPAFVEEGGLKLNQHA